MIGRRASRSVRCDWSECDVSASFEGYQNVRSQRDIELIPKLYYKYLWVRDMLGCYAG